MNILSKIIKILVIFYINSGQAMLDEAQQPEFFDRMPSNKTNHALLEENSLIKNESSKISINKKLAESTENFEFFEIINIDLQTSILSNLNIVELMNLRILNKNVRSVVDKISLFWINNKTKHIKDLSKQGVKEAQESISYFLLNDMSSYQAYKEFEDIFERGMSFLYYNKKNEQERIYGRNIFSDLPNLKLILNDLFDQSYFNAKKIIENAKISETYLNFRNQKLKLLPRNIIKLKNLISLVLSQNKLLFLPIEIYTLSNLKEIYLDNNLIRKISPSIVKLHVLSRLVLDNNQLEYIPDEIGYLDNLRLISLENNKLKIIPDSLRKNQKKIVIDLDNNLLK